ncbi:MAG: hypothetical protein ACI8TQ_003380 [Planctomycetota bacterium]|jgi:hypothetical protein
MTVSPPLNHKNWALRAKSPESTEAGGTQGSASHRVQFSLNLNRDVIGSAIHEVRSAATEGKGVEGKRRSVAQVFGEGCVQIYKMSGYRPKAHIPNRSPK